MSASTVAAGRASPHDGGVRGLVVRPLAAVLLGITTVGAVVSVPLSLGHELVTDTLLYPVTGVVLTLCGVLIVSRHRGSLVGWLLAWMGLVTVVGEFSEGYGYHRALPGAVTAQWLAVWINYVDIGTTAVLLMLFAAGSPMSARWRTGVYAAMSATVLLVLGAAFGHASDKGFAAGANPYAIDGFGIDAMFVAGQVLFLASMLTAITALVVRFRHARGIERQQLKWVAYAVSALAVLTPFAVYFFYDSVVVQVAIAFAVTALPVSICIAMLRYRLYDIDAIIAQTVVYAALSVVLAAGYLAITLCLGTLVGHRSSPWVTASATLAAAAAFGPLRRWLQNAVDRRFRRARYDAFGRIDTYLEDLRAGRAAPEHLQTVLREVLDRPELDIGYVLADSSTCLDVRGHEMTVRDADRRTRTRVERGGVLLAVIFHNPPAAADDPSLINRVLARAGLAFEIGRLRAEVAHQLAEVTASRSRILAAGYEERRRLERDLHDGAQQRLVSIGLALRHAQHELGDNPASKTLDAAVAQVTDTISDLRALANGVRPALLTNGLGFALRELASRTPLTVDVQVDGQRYPPDLESTAYFVACEAMTNAAKHSGASTVMLHAHRVDGHLVLTIRDHGFGGASTANGSGLAGLADRVAAQGGRITVTSPPGHGTIITAELPCAS
jgi:signal transduction histidine kinase